MRSGFTLAELLIALTILGVIAVFTIPKILQAQQDSRNKAVLRETYGALSSIYEEGFLKGTMTHGNTVSYLAGRLNAVKICPNDAYAEGCTGIYNWGPGWGGFVLHSGALVMVWQGGSVEDFNIDANGDTPPNTWGAGSDVMWFLGNASLYPDYCKVKPGMIGFPDASCASNWSNYAQTQADYYAVFQ